MSTRVAQLMGYPLEKPRVTNVVVRHFERDHELTTKEDQTVLRRTTSNGQYGANAEQAGTSTKIWIRRER
jgi:hypothetical protein